VVKGNGVLKEELITPPTLPKGNTHLLNWAANRLAQRTVTYFPTLAPLGKLSSKWRE
jgi:hypothetical protein